MSTASTDLSADEQSDIERLIAQRRARSAPLAFDYYRAPVGRPKERRKKVDWTTPEYRAYQAAKKRRQRAERKLV